MINHSSIRKFALASVCLLALASAQAQTADGTVVISGQLNVNTCKLSLIDASGSTNNGARTVELGTVNPPAGTITPGDLLGTKQSISFRVTNSAGTGNCAISGGLGQWNLVLDLQANQVSSDTIASKPFLTNQASTNAAGNIGVALFNNQGNQYAALATGAGYEGTKVSQVGGVFTTTGLSLFAQFMATSATAPTPGVFSATVPLLIVYN
jgi:type 1 fimbria pilin